MVFKKENWFYFLLGSVVTFLVSIYWIWVYDKGTYPGFVFLQSAMGVVSVILLLVALFLKFSKIGKSSYDYSPKEYIGNSETRVYHKPNCVAVKNIKPENKERGTLSKFKNRKYEPCDLCMVK
ncbi:MAG: hypothetical protein JXA16_09100 [Bacteroidales bacterium]|nr:hypothetical protein [Bacteroidales bacterium]